MKTSTAARKTQVGHGFRATSYPSVLVTDDDPTMRLLFATLLLDEGYTVWEAATGQECFHLARLYHPDIILLDVMLPDMTGVEVCRQIKRESDLKSALVLLVSGHCISSEYQAEGLNIGADGYIVKGVSNSEFLARIQSLVRIKRAEDALRRREEQQKRLVFQLRKALKEIRTLKGLIPICSCCKKIRDDKGYWNQLETYIGQHTEAVFSHGICPDCAERLYPEYCRKQEGG